MDPRVAATLKWALFCLIAFVAFVIGSKHYKKFARKESLAEEMRTLVADSSFYRSVSGDAARATLLKGIAMVEEARSLGLEPTAYFDLVFKHEESFLSTDTKGTEHPIREKLVRETLIRGYQHAQQLDLLGDRDAISVLREGELPDVTPKPVFAYIIDPALSPGLEKVVPNLDLRPPGEPAKEPTDLEITAARVLAGDLQSAMIIDYEGERKITDQLRPRQK
ncbi:hypothetical protein [Luteolibacter marinus]|uniref:hypothetical protein n=1 Tax=Luteolibacter marinus TaxID=2776705 RepID=UPI0018687092|nr:hypothetical protein [Luteolibacter marinus]